MTIEDPVHGPFRAVARVAVLNATRSRVLLVHKDARWVLPSVEADGLWFHTGDVADALEASLGVEVFIQRCLAGDDNERPSAERLYAGQALQDPADLAGCRWFDLSALPVLTDSALAALRVVASWLAGELGGQDWERAGWPGEMRGFVAGLLGRDDGRLRQLRTWPRSSVWRVTLPSRAFIFKASPPVFAREGEVAGALARLWPASFPEVIGNDAGRHWLLMEELGGRQLASCAVPHWHSAVSSFAAVQVAAAGAREELRRAGCPDLGIARLRAWTAGLLGPDGPVASGDVTGLTPREAACLVSRAPEFDRAWQTLGAFGIPETLEHGDFRPGNIVIDRGTPRYYDLADAAISHPFFSAVTLLDFEPLPPSREPAAELQAALRSSYLQPWARACPAVDVQAAFETARSLAPLHAALVRWFRLLPALVPREKWEFMVAYWLRRLLTADHPS